MLEFIVKTYTIKDFEKEIDILKSDLTLNNSYNNKPLLGFENLEAAIESATTLLDQFKQIHELQKTNLGISKKNLLIKENNKEFQKVLHNAVDIMQKAKGPSWDVSGLDKLKKYCPLLLSHFQQTSPLGKKNIKFINDEARASKIKESLDRLDNPSFLIQAKRAIRGLGSKIKQDGKEKSHKGFVDMVKNALIKRPKSGRSK